VKKILWLMAALTAMSPMIKDSSAATPAGFAYTAVKVNAQVNVACLEAQHGVFPSPLIIDTQTVSDQTFLPSGDELVKCTNGVIFTVKVSSANGTALDQTCTSSGVGGMELKSASWPSDKINYIFMCAGDTGGTGHFTGAGYIMAKAMGISIKVAAADAQAALAHDDYSDTVTMTISY
jgi:hypothetical protein